jgi:hypothetical protein
MVKINIKGQNVYCKKKGTELKSINSNSTDKNIKIISVGVMSGIRTSVSLSSQRPTHLVYLPKKKRIWINLMIFIT